MADTAWKVGKHGPIEKLSPRVWRVQADVPGTPLQRVMTVARRGDGKLVVHSAIAMGESEMKELDAWGPVGFIVVPNGFHRIDAPRYAARYPDAQVLAPAGSRAKADEVVKTHGSTDELPADDHVSFIAGEGVAAREAVMLVKDEDGATLVFTDMVFNMPHQPGLSGFVLRHVAGSSGGPRVSNVARLLLVKDKKALAAQLRELADTPNLRRVIVGHHETIEVEPARALRAVADTL
jgi:hypothetical protein